MRGALIKRFAAGIGNLAGVPAVDVVAAVVAANDGIGGARSRQETGRKDARAESPAFGLVAKVEKTFTATSALIAPRRSRMQAAVKG